MALIALGINAAGAANSAQSELFQYCRNRTTTRGSFGVSAGLHGIALLAIRFLTPLAADGDLDLSAYTVQPISVLVPKRAPAETALLRSRRGNLAGYESPEDPAAETHARIYVPPDLELPRAPSLPEADALLLQLNEDELTWFPELRGVVTSWMRHSAIRKPIQRPIQPGRDDANRHATYVKARPRLDISSDEAVPQDLSIRAEAASSSPALPFPSSTAVPVGSKTSPVISIPPDASLVDEARGDPANLVLLTSAPALQRQLMTIPPGSNIPEQTARDGALLAEHAATDRAPATPAAWERSAVTIIASSGSDGRENVAEGATEAGMTAATVREPRPKPPGAVTTPAGSVYDVVIVQSEMDAFTQASGALTGKPIFTVYLQVGTRKPWLLYYCLPRDLSARQIETAVISLGNPAPLSPPYPVTLDIPDQFRQPASTFRLVHGFLNAAGTLREIRFAGYGRQINLTGAFQNWLFRPALRGDSPVEVEVLIAIPPAL